MVNKSQAITIITGILFFISFFPAIIYGALWLVASLSLTRALTFFPESVPPQDLLIPWMAAIHVVGAIFFVGFAIYFFIYSDNPGVHRVRMLLMGLIGFAFSGAGIVLWGLYGSLLGGALAQGIGLIASVLALLAGVIARPEG